VKAAVSIESRVPRLGLNRSEVALALGVSPTTVDVMVAEGALPPPRRWHTRLFWRPAEIDAAISEWPSDGENPPEAGVPDRWRARA
jgi:predicted DNA-binding transcriptional regulator AlpA